MRQGVCVCVCVCVCVYVHVCVCARTHWLQYILYYQWLCFVKSLRTLNQWIITPQENAGLDLEASGHIFINQSMYITLFYECFCLKMPYLIYSWLTNIELTVHGTNSCPNRTYFLHKIHHCLNTSADTWTPFQRRKSSTKTQQCEKQGTK